MKEIMKTGMKNSECGRNGVVLNISKSRGGKLIHTNPDGSVVKVVQVGDEYFSKRNKAKKRSVGCSWLFPNHLEYNGWLWMNNLATVDVEELEDKWS